MLIQLLPSEACSTTVRRVIHAEPQLQEAPLPDPQASPFGANDAWQMAARAAGRRGDLIGPAGDYRTIRIALDQIDIVIFVTGHPTHASSGATGPIQIAQSVRPAHKIVRHAADTLYLHVTSALLSEYLEKAQSHIGPDGVPIVDPRFAGDPAIERLVSALAAMEEMDQGFSTLYADAIGLAIVTRLLGIYSDSDLPSSKRKTTALPEWRLKRVVEFIDTHFAERITLPQLADVVGVTRMHFAAQFRAATGLRPHEYLLRKRIEKAQSLLLNSSLALVEVALSVGFQTQAHFTTVFKRFVGETPCRWRRSAPGLVNGSPVS